MACDAGRGDVLYPAVLNVSGRLCMVIGGGRVAERKVTTLLECGARVRVVSPALTPKLAQWAACGRLEWVAREYRPGDLAAAWLVFSATSDRSVNLAVACEAEQNRQWVNVADDRSVCGFHVPASVRRGRLLFAVSTSGFDPPAAKRLRDLLALHLDTGQGLLAEESRRAAARLSDAADEDR
ncbi:MAG: bifunctional precorrin-2 dehydrogenase/sirohydrochlorin ferrochelatase [Alicyclobacillaceae bacterium]|nr:bifunctional precorrin-2 dehydrogenase/sirohydrochlorin ferrochelatase [Alicyclobacillaceae bacterium]